MRSLRGLMVMVLAGLLSAPLGLFAQEQSTQEPPALDQLPRERTLFIAPGQSLNRLVERIYPDSPGQWGAIRDWIVENNPHAFRNGDPDRMRANVRVKLPPASALAEPEPEATPEDYSVTGEAPVGSKAPEAQIVFDKRYVFVDPSQSLSALVPKLYPDERDYWDAITEAIVEQNARRLSGRTARATLERGTRLQIPEVREPERAAAPDLEAEPEPEASEPEREPQVEPAVGEITALAGDVHVIDSAERRRGLAQGDPVRRGDTLHTGPNARAVLRLDDGERIFLRARSRLRIRDWRLPETGPGARVVELFRGALRAVTGAIGNRSEDMYRTITPQATLGVRGTEYALRVCESGECAAERAEGRETTAEPGLYVGVAAGRVSLLNESGEATVDAGQFRHVPGPASAPTGTDIDVAELVFTQGERERMVPRQQSAPQTEPQADAEEEAQTGGKGPLGAIGILLLLIGL